MTECSECSCHPSHHVFPEFNSYDSLRAIHLEKRDSSERTSQLGGNAADAANPSYFYPFCRLDWFLLTPHYSAAIKRKLIFKENALKLSEKIQSDVLFTFRLSSRLNPAGQKSGAWSFNLTLLLQITELYTPRAGPLATLAINVISGGLAEEGTSLTANANHRGDKAKHSLFGKQQHYNEKMVLPENIRV